MADFTTTNNYERFQTYEGLHSAENEGYDANYNDINEEVVNRNDDENYEHYQELAEVTKHQPVRPRNLNDSDLHVIENQPQASEPICQIAMDPEDENRSDRDIETVEDGGEDNINQGFLLCMGLTCLLIILAAVIFSSVFLFFIFLAPFIPCLSRKTRRRTLICLRRTYFNCDCIGCKDATVVDIADALTRYYDNIEEPKNIVESLRKDKCLMSIVQSIDRKHPGLFFYYQPSGSLVERLGKLSLTSNSFLSADFDIMLIPCDITVGRGKEATFQSLGARMGEGRISSEYVWLDLNDLFLDQWQNFCLRRRLGNSSTEYRLLSTYLLKDVIKEGILEAGEVKNKFGKVNVNITVQNHGPALTVKVHEFDNNGFGCCKFKDKVWEADFTIALKCNYWPEEIENGFLNRKGKHWPPPEVVERIKNEMHCHVVPKPSKNFLVKVDMMPNSKDSSFSQCPGIEWRYSFSLVELELAELIPDEARVAFLGVKSLVKKYINTPYAEKGIKISSFSLKCILYRFLEINFKKHSWGQNDTEIGKKIIETVFKELLAELKDNLAIGCCKNFWLPNINLFEDMFEIKKTEVCYEILQIVECLENDENMEFLIDPWVEFSRCLYMNCCSPGCCFPGCNFEDTDDNENIVDQIENGGEMEDEKKEPSKIKRKKKLYFSYSPTTCPFGGCLRWKNEFHDY